ncbi:alpha-amylase family glycosyl hydrolase [Undibacterium fentianense]|uniref:Alpha-amylase n=1 Tax=Undibacterium fentianense TaxID=2828728 RepID=A0A941IG78_9BURK|nr:alpha-amylase family glycosyl hydrolase [Undibacterium fentianense]MBR7801107.1 alpha-amylase [Undibacterium fentianense]
MFRKTLLSLSIAIVFFGFSSSAAERHKQVSSHPFLWENATVYFVLTDRFVNSDKSNDLAYGRQADAAALRGFMGGDLKGITAKIKDGYFSRLGVNALWLTPPVEQIHAATDEGTGKSYGFHGYWAKDFTSIDANWGTEKDLNNLIETAHRHGIRILLDVVLNHTGPVTESDPVWPADWVRTSPTCDYQSANGAMQCTLVKNLPDFLTESDQPVELPPFLIKKWKQEGRYQREVQELEAFFGRTGYPRAPRYYLIKWQTDWVRRHGIDGFRVDTVKHVEASVWKELKQEASLAFEEWKKANPNKKLSDDPFFMTAEAYNYPISDGLLFRMDGGSRINYYANGFDSMINFGFKSDANLSYEALFSRYSQYLQKELRGYSVLNYISSHDDGSPFDPTRQRTFESATKLLLSPGSAQIYYGDEIARMLNIDEAQGDAKLRSMMDWSVLQGHKPLPEIPKNSPPQVSKSYRDLLIHWQKLGQFRRAHIAVGAGVHQQISATPYIFKRHYQKDGVSDAVIAALDIEIGKALSIPIDGVFQDGEVVRDYYTGTKHIIKNGMLEMHATHSIILLGKP